MSNEKKAHRIHLSVGDMRDAKRYLDAHIDLMKLQKERGSLSLTNHLEATFIAAIVAYGRPFTNNFSDGIAEPKLDALSLREVQERKALHDLLFSKRNDMVAHGKWAHRVTELLGMEKESTVRLSARPDFYAGVNIDDFRELVIHVHAELVDTAYALDRTTCEANRLSLK